MNILKSEKQETIIGALVEGSSIRSIERMTDVHRDTIMRLMVRVGNTCEKIMDSTMRDLSCKNIEVDEVWSFVGKKQRHVGLKDNPNEVGDFYTFIALDSDTNRSCFGLQAIDYCNWGIFRKWEGRDPRSYDLIRNGIKSEFDIFKTGERFYY